MRRRPSNFVLAYQGAEDARRDGKEQFWAGAAGWLAYSVVWGFIAALVAAMLGSLVLWGVILAAAAQ